MKTFFYSSKEKQSLSDWSIRQKIGFFIFLALFAVCIGMAIFYNGFSVLNFVILLAIALVSMALLVLPISFHPAIKVVITALLPTAAFFLMESMTHVVWETMEIDAVLLNLIFYYLFFLFFFFVSGSTKISLDILLIFTGIVGLANYFVILFRSSPILPWDLLSVGTAATVANNYTFSITYLVAELAAGFLGCIILAGKCDLHFPKLSAKRAIRGLLRLALCCVLIIPSAFYIRFLYQPDIADYTSLDNTLFTPKYMFKTNGFFVAFLMDSRYLQVSEPDGYSKEYAQSLLDEQEESAPTTDELPNIIVIMDECFSDPSILGDFSCNQDFMPYIRSLLDGAENTVSGHLSVSVLGGNTANSEFEYLTGNSMAFLPSGSIPYQQYLNKYAVSIVEHMKELGYSTTAMHPYNASGWNRSSVYEKMGFGQFLSLKNYRHGEQLRKYVSDQADFEEVLQVLNESSDPAFIFNVTMQNHSSYGTPYDNFTPAIEAQFKNTKSTKYLNNYLSLMKYTDDAVKYLLTELSNSDKKTIVVFFGDHQPNDYVVEPIYVENGLDINNQTLEEQQTRQQVPFFIWANYDIDEESNLSISANYLSTKVAEVAGLGLTKYQSFLAKMSEVLPVVNAVGYVDPNGDCHYLKEASGDEKTWLDNYEILQYYRMFDQ